MRTTDQPKGFLVPRIRSIKPEFWTSEQIAECSTNARLLFIGLWSFCDDQGVHPAACKRLKMEVFPGDSFTNEDVQSWVDELIDNGLVRLFSSQGKEYWAVTGWHHQKIDRPSIKYPTPKFDEDSSSSRRGLVDGHPPEGKGEEGKGINNMSSSPAATSTAGDVEKVIEHYQTFHPRSKPGTSERKRIRARLEDGYSVDELLQAIDGNHADPFCSGQNDRGTKYHGIGLIFRDSDHVHKYMLLADKPNPSRRARDPTLERSMAISGFVESARRIGQDSDWIETNIHELDRIGKSIDEIREHCKRVLKSKREPKSRTVNA